MSDNQTILSTSADNDKIIRELRTVRKDLASIIKENQKLQSDLKTKNETINLLINQNFTELKSLQEKHEKLIDSLAISYDNNIKNLDNKYKIFKKSLDVRLRDSVNTHYKINNEKVHILEEQRNAMQQKIDENQKEIIMRDEKIKELSIQFEAVNKLYNEHQIKCKNMEQDKILTDQRLSELNVMYENHMNTTIDYSKALTDLNFAKEKIETELHSVKQEILRNDSTMVILKTEADHAKNSYQNIHNKHLLLLNENVSKQNSIDEKTLEILSLNSKISELDKKNLLLESNRKDLNIKVTEFIHQLDNLQSEMVAAQKNILQLKAEKDNIIEEKDHYIKELDHYKQKFMESEASILEKINKIQNTATNEKNQYVSNHEEKIRDVVDRHEKQLTLLKSECNSIVVDKEKQIEGLMNHLKSYVDNQYITFGEIEKIKLANEKLKSETLDIDKKTNDLHINYKKELEDLKNSHKKEKELLIDSYNENIRKSQELNEALQNRLNQTIEALSLSKTAISNLRETNQTLEKQVQSRETEENNYQDKFFHLKNENTSLREKLERSIDLNNTFSNKEKQYESQIRQLHTKYGQLVALTKKGMNSITQ
jgi:chromosome segregation ATPase